MDKVLVYVVIIDDCSDNVDVEVFTSDVAAISRAEEIIEGQIDGFRNEDTVDCTDENTVFRKEYSTVGDSVSVVKRKMQ